MQQSVIENFKFYPIPTPFPQNGGMGADFKNPSQDLEFGVRTSKLECISLTHDIDKITTQS
jgi:hypothetical protein